jgi:hypothetical protein
MKGVVYLDGIGLLPADLFRSNLVAHHPQFSGVATLHLLELLVQDLETLPNIVTHPPQLEDLLFAFLDLAVAAVDPF